MPRRVPIALVLGLVLQLVAAVGILVAGRAGALAKMFEMPGSVAFAVGLWRLRRTAPRGVLLAIASIAVWAALAIGQVSLVVFEELYLSEWIGDVLQPTPYIRYTLVALAGVLLAAGAERNLAIAALTAVVAITAGVTMSLLHTDTLAVGTLAASLVLQLAIAVRAPASSPDAARGARGLARAGVALWWFALAIAFETIGIYALAVNDLLTRDNLAYLEIAIELALLAPVVVAIAATFAAADARVGASWPLAIAGALMTFLHSDTVFHSKWITLAFVFAGPVAFGVVLSRRHRRVLAAVVIGVATSAAGYVLLVLAPRSGPFEEPGAAQWAFTLGFTGAQIVGFGLLGGAARAVAKVVAQDNSALDRVFE